MNEKKIDLINKLLAKAESTNAAEAEALMAAAEKLMVKHGIEQAMLDAHKAGNGQASDQIVQVRMDFTGAYRGEMINLGVAVCRGLGALQNLQYSGGTGKVFSLYIIGYQSDVDNAMTLINSLQVQSMVAVKEWWKGSKASYSWQSSYDQEKARRSFVHGFGSGAGRRIHDSRLSVIKEAEATSTGTELVLVNRSQAVQAHFDGIAKGKGRSRTATGRDGAASQGFAAGQKANTGGKSMTQGRGISA